jgi:microcystin-dependent protein
MPLTRATKDNINSGNAAAGTTLRADGVGGATWAVPTVQTPPGAVMHYATQTAPDGWLVCNGSTVSRLDYPALFAAIGTVYGAGDGVTTFVLPDLRGEFIRGWDGGRGVDAGRAFGTLQVDAFKSHNHTLTDPGHSHSATWYAAGNGSGGGPYAWSQASNLANQNRDRTTTVDKAATGITIAATGSIETRPRNVALLPCIKY